MIEPLNDTTIRTEVDELLNELSRETPGDQHAHLFTREQLVPALVGLYHAAASGELDFVRMALEEGGDLTPDHAADLDKNTARDERRHIIALLNRLSKRAAGTGALTEHDPLAVLLP